MKTMTDLENREAFEKWLKECNKHVYDIYMDGYSSSDSTENMCVEWAWSAWQSSIHRQGFKLVPLEPTKEMIDSVYNEDGSYIDSIDGTPKSIFKAMIDAV